MNNQTDTQDTYPPLPEPVEGGQMYCEDCGGQGDDGESHYQGEFQPPEAEPCRSCDGSGRWKTDLFTRDQMRAYVDADRTLRAGQSEPVAKAEERIQISDIVEDAATVCERKDESGGERRQLEIAVRDALLAQLAASGSDEQRSTESTEPDRAPSGTRTAK